MADELRTDGSVDWRALPPPLPGVRCTVVLPARNEARLLPRALRALSTQVHAAGQYEVLVLANNCSDDTAARGRAFAAACSACAIHVVSVKWPAALANVGLARRALLDEAARRVGLVAPRHGVLASTDADSHVAADWLASTFAAIDGGADAVGGRILTDADPALPSDAQRVMRLDDIYRRLRSRLEDVVDPDPADPWPRHHQHFGASLAVTAAAYRAVGGQPLVPYLEDEALVQSLRLHDRPIRHCPGVRVYTSARLDGRAEVGLAWQLRQWSKHAGDETLPPSCPSVADPDEELHVWRLRRQARALWRRSSSAPDPTLARAWGRWRDAAFAASSASTALPAADAVAADALIRYARQMKTFGQLWSTLELDLRRHLPGASVPMDLAVRKLRRLTAAASRSLPAG